MYFSNSKLLVEGADFKVKCRPFAKRQEHAGQRYGKGANRPAAPARGGRYGFPGSTGRLAYGPDQRADRSLQDARQGPSFAARIAEDGEPASQDTRLPQAKEQREISRADRATWPAQVTPRRPWDPDGRFDFQKRPGASPSQPAHQNDRVVRPA